MLKFFFKDPLPALRADLSQNLGRGHKGGLDTTMLFMSQLISLGDMQTPGQIALESKPMLDQKFLNSPAVQKYIAELAGKGLTDAEHHERLATLAEFCAFVNRTPDQMIAEIFDVETQKYKKRNFYSDHVKEFSAQTSGNWSARTARGNVIRSFFIANGRRLPNEKPDWL